MAPAVASRRRVRETELGHVIGILTLQRPRVVPVNRRHISRASTRSFSGAARPKTGSWYRSTETVPEARRAASRRLGETTCSLTRMASPDTQNDSSTATPSSGSAYSANPRLPGWLSTLGRTPASMNLIASPSSSGPAVVRLNRMCDTAPPLSPPGQRAHRAAKHDHWPPNQPDPAARGSQRA
jgi:hypothetical protein